ncbi:MULTISPECIES: hypothetical protein [Pontibacillus]|uniref:DUF3953 domain-containing protein n=1 Tax=Pontibacillus chungwhensis TaxID=265426 RepID=A0ABY8V017_9BACI|nr:MULTISPECIES: hypothetical protein [Pontibacillus]MCD5324413.1 hypothetical protein [Pontibacillus sp. HN14]WIF99291.1 hypothetical protein QNI29_06425 [Pontibacillus chungwhensis]
MAKTVSGKLSLLILAVFLIQLVWFINMMSVNGLGAMVQFIQVTSITGILGIIFGGISLKKEKDNTFIPIATIGFSLLFIGIMLLFLFGFSFGG